MPQAIEIEIAGNRFQLKTNADEKHVREVAAYVEACIRALEERGAAPQTHRLALLAALNLADELFREREARARLRNRARSAARAVLSQLPRLQPKGEAER